jgi:tetratricopeptide (TPR) repeat protein
MFRFPRTSRNRCRRRCSPLRRVCSWFVILSASSAAAAAADDTVERYFRGLRERQLFSVAEGYCLKRLGDPQLPPAERALLTAELSRTFSEHALQHTGAEQEEFWQRAQSVVDELLARDPAIPRRELLTLQSMLVGAARGRALAWQADLAAHDAPLRERATAQLQIAVAGLRQTEADLADRIRSAERISPAARADGALTGAELRRLAREANFQSALTALDLARLLPPGVEHTAALHDVDKRLADLARPPLDDTGWQTRVLRVEVARLRGDLSQARLLAGALLQSGAPRPSVERAVAEQARIELADQRPDQALQRIADYRRGREVVSEELLCMQVETLLVARQLAAARGDAALAGNLLQQAQAIDAALVTGWRARSRMLLDAASESSKYGPELAALVRAGRTAWQAGHLDDAASQFARAAERADREGRADAAAEFTLTRASILLRDGRHEAALDAFRDAADRASDADQAAEADLLAAFCLGKLWERQPTQSRREAYAGALEDHRRRFADRPSAGEATWMLAAYEEHRQQWTRALALYRAVPGDHARGDAARVRIAALYEQVLARLRELGQPSGEWEARAVEELSGYVDRFPLPPARLDASHSEIAVRLARLLLNQRPPNYSDADALLDRVAASWDIVLREADRDGAAPDEVWTSVKHAGTQLRIVSLAGQRRIAEAQQVLDSATQARPQELLAVLHGLVQLATDIEPQRQQALGALQLAAARRLDGRRAELDPAARRTLDECRAQAFAAVGQIDDAIKVYEELLQASPSNRELLRTTAELLLRSPSKEALSRAKQTWRRLEAREKPGSPAWLEARYQVAASTLALGQTDECRKLVGVTRLLYPDLGNPELKQRYEQLAAQLP